MLTGEQVFERFDESNNAWSDLVGFQRSYWILLASELTRDVESIVFLNNYSFGPGPLDQGLVEHLAVSLNYKLSVQGWASMPPSLKEMWKRESSWCLTRIREGESDE